MFQEQWVFPSHSNMARYNMAVEASGGFTMWSLEPSTIAVLSCTELTHGTPNMEGKD